MQEQVRQKQVRIALRPPRHRVQRRAIAWWTLRALALSGALIGVLAAGWLIWEGSRPWTGPLLVAAGLLGVAYAAVMPVWRFAVHRWETTDEAVYAASGWIVREWRIAPVSRIQTVDTQRGPLEQLLGIASLIVTTASSSGPVHIRGLDPADAREAADALGRVTQRTPGDAT